MARNSFINLVLWLLDSSPPFFVIEPKISNSISFPRGVFVSKRVFIDSNSDNSPWVYKGLNSSGFTVTRSILTSKLRIIISLEFPDICFSSILAVNTMAARVRSLSDSFVALSGFLGSKVPILSTACFGNTGSVATPLTLFNAEYTISTAYG